MLTKKLLLGTFCVLISATGFSQSKVDYEKQIAEKESFLLSGMGSRETVRQAQVELSELLTNYKNELINELNATDNQDKQIAIRTKIAEIETKQNH